MSVMTYKGYSARVDFDPRDAIFVGHVLGVRDSISFHGATVDELRQDFANAIEGYLVMCAKDGEKPEKSYSGKLMLRIPPDVHAAAAIAAEAAGESINQWAAAVLREAAEARSLRPTSTSLGS
jgi:predicted HicB family RNase H-like nuclease